MAKIEDFMLPCLNKKLFGMDCPGCGMQRSLAHISKGEFYDAFHMYPAIYTLLLLAILIAYNFFSKKNIKPRIIYSLAILNIVIILTSYFIKILN